MTKVKAIVEMPTGTRYKYEINSKGALVLDRVLWIPTPHNYGFIPGTLCEDGDPLDIFIISDEAIPALTEAPVFIAGGFNCIDNGEQDDKLVGILAAEGPPDYYNDHISNIQHYLLNYKEGFTILGRYTESDALKVLTEAKRRSKRK